MDVSMPSFLDLIDAGKITVPRAAFATDGTPAPRSSALWLSADEQVVH
jgi:hypothetical protein